MLVEHLGIISKTERSSSYLTLVSQSFTRLLKRISNNRGASVVPWGILALGITLLDKALPILTCCDLWPGAKIRICANWVYKTRMSKIIYAGYFNVVSGLLKLFSRFLIPRGRPSTAAFIMLLFVKKNVAVVGDVLTFLCSTGLTYDVISRS